MKASNMLIAIILFSVFIVAAFSIVGFIYPSYGEASVNADSMYNEAINNVTEDINTMTTQITDSSTSDFGFALGAWQAMKLVLNAPSLIKTLIDAIAADLAIPAIFISAFLAILGIVAVFSVISAVFRKNT